MENIIVCDEKEAKKLVNNTTVKTLVISITNDKKYKVSFKRNRNIHIYRMYFADVLKGPSRLKETDALKLWKYILKKHSKYQQIIIHCHKGESRSAALAIVIGKYFNIPVKYNHKPNYNKWVIDCICDIILNYKFLRN